MSAGRRDGRAAALRKEQGSARETIFSILYRIEAAGGFSNVLLYRTLERNGFSSADRGLITEVVLGTLRQRGRLDHALGAVLPRPFSSLPVRIQVILRMGLYQAWFLDRIPDAAAVAASVDLAKRHGHRGTAGLVNAVLRRLTGQGEPPPPSLEEDPAGHLAVTLSHPRWLVERWVASFGLEEAQRLCSANNTPPPSMLRVNLLKTTRDDVIGRLAERGVDAAPGGEPEAVRVRGSLTERADLYAEGLVTMQDEGAMRVSRVVDPQPGETVLDATAAPGGKATHMAELMRNQGRVIAVDNQPAKLQALSRQAARLGLDILEAHHLDAREVGAHFRRQAHRVLLDAPCTGTGVIRRRPEIKWRLDSESIHRMALIQLELLTSVAGAVRRGGVLVYCVCSIEQEEGPQVVEEFLDRHREYEMEERQTLLPHRDGTDGFFIARMKRVAA